jgi:hypothetical protein
MDGLADAREFPWERSCLMLVGSAKMLTDPIRLVNQ